MRITTCQLSLINRHQGISNLLGPLVYLLHMQINPGTYSLPGPGTITPYQQIKTQPSPAHPQRKEVQVQSINDDTYELFSSLSVCLSVCLSEASHVEFWLLFFKWCSLCICVDAIHTHTVVFLTKSIFVCVYTCMCGHMSTYTHMSNFQSTLPFACHQFQTTRNLHCSRQCPFTSRRTKRASYCQLSGLLWETRSTLQLTM